jgi:hypothetical protein
MMPRVLTGSANAHAIDKHGIIRKREIGEKFIMSAVFYFREQLKGKGY